MLGLGLAVAQVAVRESWLVTVVVPPVVSPPVATPFAAAALTRTTPAGTNPPEFEMTTGDALIGTHSFRLEQSQDNFATIRESETVPFDSDFALASEDEGGWDWATLGQEPTGPWQARVKTLVTATGVVVATSNIISDTLTEAIGLSFVSFAQPDSKTGTQEFAAGRNIIVMRGNMKATALMIDGVAATPLGDNVLGYTGAASGSFFWEVTLSSAGIKAFTFTATGTGNDVRIWVSKLAGYGAKVGDNLYMEENQNAYSFGPPTLFSAGMGAVTNVPIGGIAVHHFVQTSGETASPLNIAFIDTREGTTFALGYGTRNNLPQGFSLPSNYNNFGSRTYVVFGPQ